MTGLFDRMNEVLPLAYQAAFALRVLVATLCGGAIGFERTKRLKEAGIRTHCLVASASALFMIISKYAFCDLMTGGAFLSGVRGADPARIAAQVVSGISFIGLAVIYRNGSTLKGLTTAAGIWATAGVGLAIGAGMYQIGIIATVIIIVLQIVMHHFNIGNDALTVRDLNFSMKDSPELREVLLAELSALNVMVVSCHITRHEGGYVNYGLTVKANREITFDEILAFMDSHPDIKNIGF